MSQYYAIPEAEFAEYVQSLGFRELDKQTIPDLALCRERVYGLRVAPDLSLRIYSGIVPGNGSRDCGEDAIRLVLMFRWQPAPDQSPKIKPAGESIRVYRVMGWKANLQKAITTLSQATACPRCPACGAAMGLRKSRKGTTTGTKFWGCLRYPECRTTLVYQPAQISPQKKSKAVLTPKTTLLD